MGKPRRPRCRICVGHLLHPSSIIMYSADPSLLPLPSALLAQVIRMDHPPPPKTSGGVADPPLSLLPLWTGDKSYNYLVCPSLQFTYRISPLINLKQSSQNCQVARSGSKAEVDACSRMLGLARGCRNAEVWAPKFKGHPNG